jgi:hypothetical protein
MDTNISAYEMFSSVPNETLFIGLRYLLQAFASRDNFQLSSTGACIPVPPLARKVRKTISFFLLGQSVSVAERAKL